MSLSKETRDTLLFGELAMRDCPHPRRNSLGYKNNGKGKKEMFVQFAEVTKVQEVKLATERPVIFVKSDAVIGQKNG